MKKIPIAVLALCLTIFALACSDSTTGEYGMRRISSLGDAALYITTTPEGDGNIRAITLYGTFSEMGEQYGELLKEDLEKYYEDVIEDYLMAEKGISYDELTEEAELSYSLAIDDMKAMMQGVAEGSGLTLLQVQIINSSMLRAIEACSSVAAWGEHTGGGPLVIGRNWDMNTGSLDIIKDYMMVVVYNPPSGNSVADINYIGQFQYFQTAISDKKLWIDMQNGSLSSTRDDETKQDPNTAIFQFLRDASTMEELDAMFMSEGSSASFIMTVADPEVAYSYFWCTQGTYRFEENDQTDLLSTSNHFVEYPPTWEINELPADPAAQMYTELRRNNWLTLANSSLYNGRITDETMQSILARTIEEGGGSFPSSGYPAETVYQIIAVPDSLRLWIRLPKYFGWEKIELEGLF